MMLDKSPGPGRHPFTQPIAKLGSSSCRTFGTSSQGTALQLCELLCARNSGRHNLRQVQQHGDHPCDQGPDRDHYHLPSSDLDPLSILLHNTSLSLELSLNVIVSRLKNEYFNDLHCHQSINLIFTLTDPDHIHLVRDDDRPRAFHHLGKVQHPLSRHSGSFPVPHLPSQILQ